MKIDRPARVSEGHGRDETILIVVDDDASSIDLRNWLVGDGYAVRCARSATEALASLKSTPVDLIFMDLMLPDTDGLILCSTLRAQFATPTIVLNARHSDVDRALALQLGALECLSKPLDRDEVLCQAQLAVSRPGANVGSR